MVTGGAGYIGSHVVKALSRRGLTVMTVDNLSTGHRDAVLSGDLAVGDLADGNFISRIVGTFQPDAVMHFAASIEVAESVRNPLKYYANNAANAVNLLDCLVRHGVGVFIFSSTAAVYGVPDQVPIPETVPVKPINPYGRAKAFIEQVMQDLSASNGLRYVSLRYFNAAGADPACRIGERHDPESHLIPLILKAAKGEKESISIYGTDYGTPDGTCIRDYVHVEDLAEAHYLALEYLLQGGNSDVFNCGYGHGSSVREVIDAAKRVTGIDIPTVLSPRRPGDPPVLVAESTKLRTSLRWSPQYDDLERIIQTAWEWERRR